MCLFIYSYIYIYIYTHTHVCVGPRATRPREAEARLWEALRTFPKFYVFINLFVYICYTYVYLFMCIYIYIYIHIHTHIHSAEKIRKKQSCLKTMKKIKK